MIVVTSRNYYNKVTQQHKQKRLFSCFPPSVLLGYNEPQGEIKGHAKGEEEERESRGQWRKEEARGGRKKTHKPNYRERGRE